MQYCIVNISHEYFGRIGTIEGKENGYYLFKSREERDPFPIYVTDGDIAKLC